MDKHTLPCKKSEILTLKKLGKSLREISALTDVSKTSVARIIAQYSTSDSLERKKGSGRPEKLSRSIKSFLIKKIDELPTRSSSKYIKIVEETHDIAASKQTMCKCIGEIGFKSCSPLKKQFLNKTQIESRIRACKEWIYKSDKDWEDVVFSDESKFNVFGSDGINKIWIRPGERLNSKNIIPTFNFGGRSAMVWGCFSSRGVGNLVLIEGIMDQYMFLDIIKNNLKDSASNLGHSRFTFQQDNDPKHTSKLVKEYFKREKIGLSEWPSQSPDSNPIENI